MSATITYNSELAQAEYVKPWIRRREAVELCGKFGVSEYKWRDISAMIPKHPRYSAPGKALFSRDELLRVLQG